MKKRGMAAILSTTIGIIVLLCLNLTAWAEDEFMLEEITVTAEKRAVNIQELPMSLVAIEGAALSERGKITTTQILEDVPNVHFVYNSDQDDENPNGNVWIRGVKSTQETGGGNPPSSTATYVDGVYEGIGGNFDINRVEVLRGPQGTLYGRSATGGVVAFYTNDPELSGFEGSASIETGEANLINTQAAVNVPVGDKFAFRVAGHYYEKDGYYNPDGDYQEIKEWRVKALYEPTSRLDLLLSLTGSRKEDGSGGNTATLDSPTGINYNGIVTDTAMSVPDEYLQGALTVNYDFDKSSLTYIGAIHTYDATGHQGINTTGAGILTAYWDFPTDTHHTQEVRLASDSEGPFSWLVGANFYHHDYEKTNTTIQLEGFDFGGNIVDDQNTYNADVYSSTLILDIKNYGFFTEETYELRDDLRVTGGLRFDWTDIVQTSIYNFNTNLNLFFNSLNPPTWADFALEDEKNDYSNVTYKLRFEYDVTPDSMLYAMTATGILPGITQVSPNPNINFLTGDVSVSFRKLPFEEIELTSYEIGSKNRFLNNTLEINAAAFFYDYEGYQEAINTSEEGMPYYVVLSVPVEMLGLEVDATWLLTHTDKLTLTAGWLKTEITDFPTIEGVGDTRQYAALDEITGIPEFTATLGYDHTFSIGNGSSLVPRAEVKYTKGHYLAQITGYQVNQLGALPYNYQDDYVIANIGATWTSPSGMYALTGYIRNLFDEEYKTKITLNTSNNSHEVEVGDPRAWGLVLNVKF